MSSVVVVTINWDEMPFAAVKAIATWNGCASNRILIDRYLGRNPTPGECAHALGLVMSPAFRIRELNFSSGCLPVDTQPMDAVIQKEPVSAADFVTNEIKKIESALMLTQLEVREVVAPYPPQYLKRNLAPVPSVKPSPLTVYPTCHMSVVPNHFNLFLNLFACLDRTLFRTVRYLFNDATFMHSPYFSIEDFVDVACRHEGCECQFKIHIFAVLQFSSIIKMATLVDSFCRLVRFVEMYLQLDNKTLRLKTQCEKDSHADFIDSIRPDGPLLFSRHDSWNEAGYPVLQPMLFSHKTGTFRTMTGNLVAQRNRLFVQINLPHIKDLTMTRQQYYPGGTCPTCDHNPQIEAPLYEVSGQIAKQLTCFDQQIATPLGKGRLPQGFYAIFEPSVLRCCQKECAFHFRRNFISITLKRKGVVVASLGLQLINNPSRASSGIPLPLDIKGQSVFCETPEKADQWRSYFSTCIEHRNIGGLPVIDVNSMYDPFLGSRCVHAPPIIRETGDEILRSLITVWATLLPSAQFLNTFPVQSVVLHSEQPASALASFYAAVTICLSMRARNQNSVMVDGIDGLVYLPLCIGRVAAFVYALLGRRWDFLPGIKSKKTGGYIHASVVISEDCYIE